MKWKGKELATIGELMDLGVNACATKEEAQEFMRLYIAEEPAHARNNIGYLAGYYDRETKQRIFEWFDVVHPIFGRSNPTPEEAFEAGARWGDIVRQRDG